MPVGIAKADTALYNGLDEIIDATLLIQGDAASEELGDTLAIGPEVVKAGMEAAPFFIPAEHVALITDGVARCLAARYIGFCSVAKHCTGKKQMDEPFAVFEHSTL